LWGKASSPFFGKSGDGPEQKARFTKNAPRPTGTHPWGDRQLYSTLSAGFSPLQHPQDVALLLQIHDELVFQVRCQDATALGNLLIPMMEHVAQLSVPLSVTSSFGQTLDQ
jgi:hypothetical protein